LISIELKGLSSRSFSLKSFFIKGSAMHFWRWVWTFLFCLIVVSVLGFVKFNQIKAAIAFGESFPEPSETVQVIVVEQSQWQSKLSVMGEVVATRSLDLRNELAGVITKVGFVSGDKVAKGSLLLQLDVENEEAQLAALQAQVSIVQLDVNRFSELLKSNASSQDQLDRAKAQLAVAKANVRALQSTISKKTLLAPFDAKVGLHQLEVGGYLSGNTLITRLVSVSDAVWLDFLVPQEHANLAQGDVVQVISESLLTEVSSAKVIAISQEIDVVSRNLRARALWLNTPKQIKPGALVEVKLSIGNNLNIFRIPSVAVRYDAFGTYVFALDKDKNGDLRATRQSIKVQAKDKKTSIVTSGLSIGQNIASIGSSKLREGILVNVAASEEGNAVNE
jgi:membrane fusion protein (multidrug efflux system)